MGYNITVNDDECFSCCAKDGLTTHHVLPQTLKPKRNVIIRLCKKCHTKIHEIDKSTTIAFLSRLITRTGQLTAEMKDCVTQIKTPVQKVREKKVQVSSKP